MLGVKDGHINDFRKCSNSAQIYIPNKTDLSLRVSRDGSLYVSKYEGWKFNSGNYLFTTDTK